MTKDIIFSSALWAHMSAEEKESMYHCLDIRMKEYTKDSPILLIGEKVLDIGVLVSGQAVVVSENIEGQRNVIAFISPGDLFAEVYALSGKPSGVAVYAQTKVEVAFIDARKATTVCQSACPHHKQLIWNLMQIVSTKNVALNDKIQCLGQRGIREKVSVFLALKHNQYRNDMFDIHMNRQEMADYLCVDRSALSAVLSKMKEEGIIDYHKSTFSLKIKDRL